MKEHQAGKRRQCHPQRRTMIRNACRSRALHGNVIESEEVIIVTILELKRARGASRRDIRREEGVAEGPHIRLSERGNDYAIERSGEGIDESTTGRAVIGQIIGNRVYRARDRAEGLTQGAGVRTGAQVCVIRARMRESGIAADIGEVTWIGKGPRRERTGLEAAVLNAFGAAKCRNSRSGEE